MLTSEVAELISALALLACVVRAIVAAGRINLVTEPTIAGQLAFEAVGKSSNKKGGCMFARGTLLASSLTAVLLAATTTCAEGPEAAGQLSAELSVEMDGPLLANFPLQYKLTITNTGKQPLMYRGIGPGRCPPATGFVVSATDQQGNLRQFRLDNGQNPGAWGQVQKIKEVEALPAASRPGVYTLEVVYSSFGNIDDWPRMIAPPITVNVLEDNAAVAVAENRLLDQPESNAFTQHMVETYGIAPVVKTWMKQLIDQDPQVAMEAAKELAKFRRLPVGGDAILREAVTERCQLVGQRDDPLLLPLTTVARNAGIDRSPELLLTVATSDVDERARKRAIEFLAEIPGERVDKTLVDLMGDRQSPLYVGCLCSLARRHNPVALPLLLELAVDQDSERRAAGIRSLGLFRDEPQARLALNHALADTHQLVREGANFALNWPRGLQGDAVLW